MFCIYANKLVEKICIYTFNQAIKAQKNTFKRKKYHSNYKRTKLARLTESRDSLQPLTTHKKDTPTYGRYPLPCI
jgi:hypothetical protein